MTTSHKCRQHTSQHLYLCLKRNCHYHAGWLFARGSDRRDTSVNGHDCPKNIIHLFPKCTFTFLFGLLFALSVTHSNDTETRGWSVFNWRGCVDLYWALRGRVSGVAFETFREEQTQNQLQPHSHPRDARRRRLVTSNGGTSCDDTTAQMREGQSAALLLLTHPCKHCQLLSSELISH